jgi:hypothetical protein
MSGAGCDVDRGPCQVSKPATDLSAGLEGGDLIIYRRRLDPVDQVSAITRTFHGEAQ